jgi:prevent-host-death family protein
MTVIPAADAQRHFRDLLDRLARGESFEITENGKLVARLSPAHAPASIDRAASLAAVATLQAMRGIAGRAASDEINTWKNEGRRF